MVIYKTNDEMVIDFLLMYCEGKSFLWNLFFGWRETKALSDGTNMCTFKIPRKIYKMAEKAAKKYGYEIVGD